MADPFMDILGRRPFRGTGVVDDYFPQAPDLSFLGRPSFIPRGAGYDPSLDPASLVASGLSPRNAMYLQGVRQQLHQNAEMGRFQSDSDAAFQKLGSLDPSKGNFSTQLLEIFRTHPRAAQNQELLQQVDLISKLAPTQKSFSVEDIEDPDVYEQAVTENWGSLSPNEAKRRAARAQQRLAMRSELAALGMSRQELDKMKDLTQEDFMRERGRLMRESKKATADPWTKRLSDKEREAVRSEIQTAMAPSDFETEFNDVLKSNPGLTRDAYVKQYKGDPDYASYQLRRAMESGVPQRLMREYGLTQNEVASLFGISPTESAAAPTWPTEAPTTFGPQATAAPLSTTGVPQPPPGPQNAPKGLVEAGNIDLTTRPIIQNADGTQSTVRSVSFEVNGKEVLVPTVSDDGRIMSDDEAFETFRRTGRHLGIFDSPQAANDYAKKLHDDYEQGRIKMKTQPPAASGIPSYAYRLNPTPIDSIIKNVEQVTPTVENVFRNITTDPLGKIGDLALGRPAQEVFGEALVAPSQERDNAKWNAAKTSMMEYLNSLGKSPQEVEEMLGSILRGDRLPIAVFLKDGATKADKGRLTASTALGQAFQRAKKTAAGSALTDSSGSHGWENVARALAQEYFTRKGVIAPTNSSAPVGTAPSSAPIPVSSLDDIRKLPIGASFTYKGQTRVKTSEVK